MLNACGCESTAGSNPALSALSIIAESARSLYLVLLRSVAPTPRSSVPTIASTDAGDSRHYERAILIGVDAQHTRALAWPIEESLDELALLTETAGGVVVGLLTQRMREPHPTTYLGSGKLDELVTLCRAEDADLVIADDELTATQQRSLEEATGKHVVDRTMVILDIFAQHAQTREGRLQVELAQARYSLPRLAGGVRSFSRLGGGIGTRGPGETKLESDRRRIRRRIAALNREIEEVDRQRSVQRRRRTRQGIPVIAVVGYTNTGKSTLLNTLTHASVRTEDRLFATLDPTTRRLTLPNLQEVLLTDTVGFIRKLPTDLVAAFRATLQEVHDADLLLHVVDASQPTMLAQTLTVYEELATLGAGNKLIVTALNKMDLVPGGLSPDDLESFPNPAPISALTRAGLPDLLEKLAAVLAVNLLPIRVTLPYDAGELAQLFRQRGSVESEEYVEKGLRISGKVPPALLPAFAPYSA